MLSIDEERSTLRQERDCAYGTVFSKYRTENRKKNASLRSVPPLVGGRYVAFLGVARSPTGSRIRSAHAAAQPQTGLTTSRDCAHSKLFGSSSGTQATNLCSVNMNSMCCDIAISEKYFKTMSALAGCPNNPWALPREFSQIEE